VIVFRSFVTDAKVGESSNFALQDCRKDIQLRLFKFRFCWKRF